MTAAAQPAAVPASVSALAGAGAAPAREQTRARDPDQTGFVERGGVRVFYEVYGAGEPTVLLLPTWSIVGSRFWKFQIPYLTRRGRVITFDGRGNGRSDRPVGAEAYSIDEFVLDALAVMDATATETASLVALSAGALWGTVLAADHPNRVQRIAYIGPAVDLAPGHPDAAVYRFDLRYEEADGPASHNHDFDRTYHEFLEFFFGRCLNEPHSTKQIEDCIGWGLQTTAEALADATRGLVVRRAEPFRDVCARVRCPTLVIHGDQDLIRPLAQGRALAEATGGRLVTLAGSGHLPLGRDPVIVNGLLDEFIFGSSPPRRWRRGRSRPQRALYISSPIGLGHARRDLAIARELRKLHPGLEIDWLAQHPVTAVLEDHGERIHPASRELASESAHMQSESSGHDLHCFQAFRRMDEILVANFMVFRDLIREERYDLWIGDEAWELDYFLHENPELKSASYVWLSDFVGWLPMPDRGEHEAMVTADLNAEMIEQVARYPRVRDRSIFIGHPEDIVPDAFGPGLPSIREWTSRNFSFSGYVTSFPRDLVSDRSALRAELGYAPDEPVCVVTVGGSGVGESLLRRAADSFESARRLVPGLRMVLATGPRIDPGELPVVDGLEVHAYVPDLYRHLAACDLAIVQGGLTTAMELTASRRPFIYFPLGLHFEQNFHVAHRLQRYRAGRRMEFEDSPPDAIAVAIGEEIGREVDYLPVETDGAARAAALIAETLTV